MKITCYKTDLLNSINIVLKAVPSKTTMPILDCIYIRAKKNIIKFLSNDMELAIETQVTGNIITEGSVAINAKLFSDIVRKLPDNHVTIDVDQNYLTKITCEKAKFNIPGKEGDDFPILPDIEKQNSIKLSQFTLKEMIRQTVFSISEKDSNKIMSGELFEVTEKQMRITSLDGYRISVRKVQLKNSYPSIKVIVPGKTLNEISKILSNELEDELQMFFNNNHILFEFNNTLVLSRLIQGEFFKIDQMLSCEHKVKISISKKELLNCLERSILLVKENDKSPLIFQIQEDEINLKINTQIGSLDENILITKKEGDDITIGFNSKYVIDALKVIDDDIVDIYMINPKAPCFIKDSHDSYVYLILPMNF